MRCLAAARAGSALALNALWLGFGELPVSKARSCTEARAHSAFPFQVQYDKALGEAAHDQAQHGARTRESPPQSTAGTQRRASCEAGPPESGPFAHACVVRRGLVSRRSTASAQAKTAAAPVQARARHGGHERRSAVERSGHRPRRGPCGWHGCCAKRKKEETRHEAPHAQTCTTAHTSPCHSPSLSLSLSLSVSELSLSLSLSLRAHAAQRGWIGHSAGWAPRNPSARHAALNARITPQLAGPTPARRSAACEGAALWGGARAPSPSPARADAPLQSRARAHGLGGSAAAPAAKPPRRQGLGPGDPGHAQITASAGGPAAHQAAAAVAAAARAHALHRRASLVFPRAEGRARERRHNSRSTGTRNASPRGA